MAVLPARLGVGLWPGHMGGLVSTDPGIWGWTSDIGQLGFTVTFSLGLTPEEVLRHYGADTTGAEHLSRHDAWSKYPPAVGRSQLRAGTIGRWGFCFEEAGVEGIKPTTLSRLSAETETISFFAGPGASRFILLKDGQGVEAFEPGLPESVHGNVPRRFWDNTTKILERAGQTGPTPPVHAVLQVIAKHVRGLLDRSILEGPLLTGFVTAADAGPVTQANPVAGRANPHFAAQPAPTFSTLRSAQFTTAQNSRPEPAPQFSTLSATQFASATPYTSPTPFGQPASAPAPAPDHAGRRAAPEFDADPDVTLPLSAVSLQMLQELQAGIQPVRTRRDANHEDFDRVEGARAS
jgi:hypothetical protein